MLSRRKAEVPVQQEYLVRSSGAEPGLRGKASFTHRWPGKAGESSLTTLSGQTNDAPLPSQPLGTWRTIRTLGEEERVVTEASPGRDPSHPLSTFCAAPFPQFPQHRTFLLVHGGVQVPLLGLAGYLQGGHHLQVLLSRQKVLQDLEAQGHQLGRGNQCLLEHLWDHLFQKDQGDQGVQGCPRRNKYRKS